MADSDSTAASASHRRGKHSRQQSLSRIPTISLRNTAGKRHTRSRSEILSSHRSCPEEHHKLPTIKIPLDRIPPNMPQLTGIGLAALRVPDENVIAEVYGLVVWQAHQLHLIESERSALEFSPIALGSQFKNRSVCFGQSVENRGEAKEDKDKGISEGSNIVFDNETAESEHIENVKTENLGGTGIGEGMRVNIGARPITITTTDGTAVGANGGKVDEEDINKEVTNETKQGGGSLENYTFTFIPPGDQKTIHFPQSPPDILNAKKATKANLCEDGEDVLTIRARPQIGYGKITVHGKVLAGHERKSERLTRGQRAGRWVVGSSEMMDDTQQEDSLLGRIALITALIGYLVWVVITNH